MNVLAANSVDVRFGDTALANFFGIGNAARFSGTDQMASVLAFARTEPESLYSQFVTNAFDLQEGPSYGDIPTNPSVPLWTIIGAIAIAFVLIFKVDK